MNYNKKSVKDVALQGKRVLCRDKRIVAALPTIQYLIDHGAKVILCSHMGKPKGEFKPELSLGVVAKRLSELLGQPVKMAKDVVGPDAKALAALRSLAALNGCQAHCSVILSPPDESTYKKLGLQLTCEPQYQTNNLYHR